ncbi:MAG: IclR family transcriptional regulator [Aminipila sp.]
MEKEKLTPIEKTLLILETMSNHPDELKVAEISEITQLNRTTVHRILQELLAKKWVIQDFRSKKYIVGPMAFHVGMAYINNDNMESKVMEILDRIGAEMKESVGYATRVGDQVISLYEMEVHQPYKMNYRPGQFYPINRGCYGKCLMAYYDQDRVKQLLSEQKFEKVGPNTLTDPEAILLEYEKIRKQGYAISDEEVAPHVFGISVPVFDQSGEAKGCLACSFLKCKDDTKKINQFLKMFKQGAEEITSYLP